MKASRGNRSLRAPILFAAFAGLAVSASGCIIDGSSSPPPTCLPDLTVRWQIRSTTAGNPFRTCAQAGGADLVTAWINGPSFPLQAFDAPCPANSSAGSFLVELPFTATYEVSLELTSPSFVDPLSETQILVQPVDCSGATVTPVADMLVDF
jgi:hypothetical protein